MPKKTFAIAAAANAHLIVQLKANQKSLCQEVETGCIDALHSSVFRTVDAQKRNRHETRTIAVFDASPIITCPEWRTYVAAIICIERCVLAFQPTTGLWKSSRETSYYLSNRPIDAEQAADAVRKHWHIENRSHHVRDVTMGEDASRIRTNPGIFARLRSFAANILRFNQQSSVRQDRYAAALGGYAALAKLRFS
ncbi:MAG: ISAs1 family transposase [Formivibrio sp.]|nr:ISAs1 family transposase [Formivibrio sp.]